MNSSMYSLNNFDLLTRSSTRMQAKDRPIDIQAIAGDMGEEHHSWFYKHYTLYRQQAMEARKLELEH